MNTDGLIDHAINALWAAIVGATTIIGAAIVRLWRHEERLKALEANHNRASETLSELSTKIDHNHNAITDRLASAVEDIRADLRVITQRCLMVGRDDE
jgi:chromosome segregation ATPase